MKIVGFDPGTARVGWSVITFEHNQIRTFLFGCFTTPQTDTPEFRLLTIFNNVLSLLQKYSPDVVSIEEIYYATNAKTVIPVAQARGTILLACAQQKISVVSYSPRTVKITITGDGNANKNQMQFMIKKLLKLNSIPKPDDAADAVAVALTHAYYRKL